MKVKILSSTNGNQLEQWINEFLASGECSKMIDIKYSSTEKTHDVLIIYEG